MGQRVRAQLTRYRLRLARSSTRKRSGIWTRYHLAPHDRQVLIAVNHHLDMLMPRQALRAPGHPD